MDGKEKKKFKIKILKVDQRTVDNIAIIVVKVRESGKFESKEEVQKLAKICL